MQWRDLEVWKKSHRLTLAVYKASSEFPKEELFGLTSQFRRAASSIPLNIVEGHSRKTSKEFLQFLNVARGSLEELRYLLILCSDLQYLNEEDFSFLQECSREISLMLNALIKSISRKKS